MEGHYYDQKPDNSVFDIYKGQLIELIQFYLNNPDRPCSLLHENIKILAYELIINHSVILKRWMYLIQ